MSRLFVPGSDNRVSNGIDVKWFLTGPGGVTPGRTRFLLLWMIIWTGLDLDAQEGNSLHAVGGDKLWVFLWSRDDLVGGTQPHTVTAPAYVAREP